MSTMCEHSMSEHHVCVCVCVSRKKRTQRRSSWALFLGRITHHTICQHSMCQAKEENTKNDRRHLSTSHIRHHCISPDIRHHIAPHHTFTHHKPKEENTKKKFLGRITNSFQSTSFFMKTPFKSIRVHRKVRELPRKMRRSSWAEFLGRKSAKKHAFFHANLVQEHPRRMKSTRITAKNIEK